jgi:hypothetical protein
LQKIPQGVDEVGVVIEGCVCHVLWGNQALLGGAVLWVSDQVLMRSFECSRGISESLRP